MPRSRHIHLSDLMESIGDTIYADFGTKTYRIIAEITDVKIYYQRSYAFLTLVEKSGNDITASASGVIWRDAFPIIRQFEKATGIRFDQNLELVLEVQVQFHTRYGLRINIISIDESYTLGKLEQDRQKTLNRLIEEHPKTIWLRDGVYRSNNHMQKLPMVAQRIALVAAPGSDGRRDFLHELENNAYHLDYSVAEFPAQVQGEAAAGQISAQLERISSLKNTFDLVALVRGGGGNTDFSAFDSYAVGLAVAQCPYPVFTGIGHERNIGIADLLAFSPEKTPTKCAASITEHNLEFLAFVQNVGDSIGKRAMRMIDNFRQQTKHIENNILKSAQWQITTEKQFMMHAATRMQMADPMQVLKRGFSLVFKNGKHISNAMELTKGDTVELRFQDGMKRAIMEE